MFDDEHYLKEIRRRYGVPAKMGARITAHVGNAAVRGTVVGARNELQLRVRLDSGPIVISFSPSSLTYQRY